jgi:branched-chain amino acid aminotransferase
MKIDLNTQIVDAEQARVSPFDAGYMYGDGLFETLRSYDGHPFDLPRHLARMQRAARLLQIPFDGERARWEPRLKRLLAANELLQGDAMVRIQLSRGGLPETDHVAGDPDGIEAVEFVTTRRIASELAVWQRDGARVMSVQSSFARGNFPQFKSLNYLPSMMALRFARAAGFAEAIRLSDQGRVLEGATSNVFILRGGVLSTPPASAGILPGLARRRILELAVEIGLPCEELACDYREILVADEILLSSSVKEVLPVVGVDRTTIGDGRPGPWTRQLHEAYRSAVDAEREP